MANEQLLRFYWSAGEDIAKKKAVSKWDDGVIATMSRDLSARFPESGGFSVTNLGYVKRFYELYSQLDKFYPQLVGNTKYEKLKEAIKEELEGLQAEMMAEMQKMGLGQDENAQPDKEKAFQFFVTFLDGMKSMADGTVWFMIHENYGRYNIGLYYDNLHNQAHGEDL